MTNRDLFISGCRLLAIYIIWTGLQHLVSLCNVAFGFFRPEMTAMPSYALHAVVDLTVGTYLLGATGLANLLFGRNSEIRP